MPRSAIVFDTEFTAWEGSVERGWRGPGEHKEILQIGAIALNAETLEETETFSVLVRPVKNPILSDYIVKLTRITNERVGAEGVDLATGVGTFLEFAAGRSLFCYGRDDKIIASNARLLGTPQLWPAHVVASDLKEWLTRIGIAAAGVNSGNLAEHVGAASQGVAHDAVVDSRSLAAAIRYLVARGAPNPLLGL